VAPALTQPATVPLPAAVQAPEPNVILSASLAEGTPTLDTGVTWRLSKIVTTPTGQVQTSEALSWVGSGGQAKIKLPEGHFQVDVAYGLAEAQGDFAVPAGGRVEKSIPLGAGMIAAEAVQIPRGQRVDSAIFTLFSRKPNATPEQEGLSSSQPASFYVNAGEYTLSINSGLAKIETPVTVQAGKVSAVNVALNVGTLEIKTFAVEGQPKLVPAWHRLFRADRKEGESSPPLLTLAGPSHRVQLPAGAYRLETSYGQVIQNSVVVISAGQVTSQSVILNAGEAKVNMASAEPNTVCAIYEAKEPKGEPVGRAAGPAVTFIVKSGLYTVDCRKKAAPAAASTAQVQVVAGETHTVDLVR